VGSVRHGERGEREEAAGERSKSQKICGERVAHASETVHS
jgi:hypothetical protein